MQTDTTVNKSKTISCIIPVYNEEASIVQFITTLHETLKKLGYKHEILIIDDGSIDGTMQQIMQVKNKYPIHYRRFSRNFGKENAISAGLDYAKGDAIILMDADFQHPVELLPDFVAKWEAGYDMVYAVRLDRKDEPWLKRVCAKTFYKMTSRINRLNIPANAGDFRLLDRKIVNALQKLPERNRFMKGLYSWVGYKEIGLPYEVQPRKHGESRWNFASLLDLAITGITSFSAFPLRMIALGGIITASLAFCCGLWIIFSSLIFGIHTPGWAAIVIAIVFFGGLQLFALGVVGEYIGRIFDEVKQRPHYIVDEQASFDESF